MQLDAVIVSLKVRAFIFIKMEERKSQWIAAVGRKDWIPNEYSWICSVYFVSGE